MGIHLIHWKRLLSYYSIYYPSYYRSCYSHFKNEDYSQIFVRIGLGTALKMVSNSAASYGTQPILPSILIWSAHDELAMGGNLSMRKYDFHDFDGNSSYPHPSNPSGLDIRYVSMYIFK